MKVLYKDRERGSMEKYFPMFYDITGWNVCFFGAGNVAERRIKTLLLYSCRIFVISERVTEEIEKFSKEGKVIWVKRALRKGGEVEITESWKNLKERYSDYFEKEKEFSMVFACTNDRKINEGIYEYCKKRKIPVNTADCREECDFYFPGLLEWEEIVIGVTGNGKNHKKVKMVMDKLRMMFLREDEK
jgi:siroheme synthase (precorrin-2 oxidase/ferrochelatase)